MGAVVARLNSFRARAYIERRGARLNSRRRPGTGTDCDSPWAERTTSAGIRVGPQHLLRQCNLVQYTMEVVPVGDTIRCRWYAE